ncbi:TadA family conjugal transfer-associated ATPase [Propionimicrobium sp. PCR01-08-3]|uniref:TadA family conjugal transfer-associated ATPase n=1 Tax=Propionimicrobium sp. PCR01-08-3 TaxID=3052086 RepID=UPI00255C4074|nr:TadA family conjugal transfer-associated ATPase [Propionimicrobium sp. PCR01-08-3]WIY82105.1 TadA family conjugal transfer-associated ATPase [Propionimicrobium sp. PCR01-08-3]
MDDHDLEMVRVRLAGLGRRWTPQDVADALRALGLVVSDAMVLYTVGALRQGSIGAGRLEPLLCLEGLTDILVNGPDQVFIDRGHGLEPSDICFDSDAEVRQLATRLAASVGRRLDDACPFADARLADGTRLHAVLGTITDPGTCLSLRIPARRSFSLDDWVTNGSICEEMAQVLRALVASKTAFLISGGTGSGKTTLLAGLLGLMPHDQRLVIVEDSRELAPDHPHCIRMESRQANSEGAGAITLTDLVRQALRMRPDRLVLGEVRGAELCDLLTALNTGHEGGCGTVHANSVADVPARLEALAALGGLNRDACHAQVASALRAIVQVSRLPDGRRTVTQIGNVIRAENGQVSIEVALASRDGTDVRRGPGWQALAELLGLTITQGVVNAPIARAAIDLPHSQATIDAHLTRAEVYTPRSQASVGGHSLAPDGFAAAPRRQAAA